MPQQVQRGPGWEDEARSQASWDISQARADAFLPVL